MRSLAKRIEALEAVIRQDAPGPVAAMIYQGEGESPLMGYRIGSSRTQDGGSPIASPLLRKRGETDDELLSRAIAEHGRHFPIASVAILAELRGKALSDSWQSWGYLRLRP
jgi:hypothetical protein